MLGLRGFRFQGFEVWGSGLRSSLPGSMLILGSKPYTLNPKPCVLGLRFGV